MYIRDMKWKQFYLAYDVSYVILGLTLAVIMRSTWIQMTATAACATSPDTVSCQIDMLTDMGEWLHWKMAVMMAVNALGVWLSVHHVRSGFLQNTVNDMAGVDVGPLRDFDFKESALRLRVWRAGKTPIGFYLAFITLSTFGTFMLLFSDAFLY